MRATEKQEEALSFLSESSRVQALSVTEAVPRGGPTRGRETGKAWVSAAVPPARHDPGPGSATQAACGEPALHLPPYRAERPLSPVTDRLRRPGLNLGRIQHLPVILPLSFRFCPSLPQPTHGSTVTSTLSAGFLSEPQWHDSLGSTNDEALSLAAKGAPEGTLVAADRQTAGRGRLGRPWTSPPSVGLYASLLLRPPLGRGELTLLPLLAGVAVAEAIQQTADCEALLKWPNDVLIGGRKVAGILVEAEMSEDSRAVVVAGLGVNVSTAAGDLPPRVLYPATSLLIETGRRIDRETLLDVWRTRFAAAYRQWLSGDATPLLDRWKALHAMQGRTIMVAGADGVTVEGIGEGIDEQGALLLRTAAGTLTRVVAGDVLKPTRRSSAGRC